MNDIDCRLFTIGIDPHGETGGSVADLGFKAFNLRRLARIGLEVPPAIVVGTGVCRAFHASGGILPGALRDRLAEAMERLEHATRLEFGGSRRPLLVSVRSGAPVSMPGMMDTLLNVGLCDATMPGFLRLHGNPRLAWDCYRRLVQGFGEVVHGIDPRAFEAALADRLAVTGVVRPQELDFRGLRELTQDFLQVFERESGEPFPQSPGEQLDAAILAVVKSWNSERARTYRASQGIDDDSGTAVTIQQMVFGNADSSSGSGVAFTRDPSTGANRLYVDYAVCAQGEDIVSGRVGLAGGEELGEYLPELHSQLVELRRALETEFGDVQEFEFTVQTGELFLLQTRTAKRTPLAALRSTIELAEEGVIDADTARARIAGIDPEALDVPMLVDDSATLLAEGIGASVGVVSGEISLDVDDAITRARRGSRVILVRDDIATSDIAGLEVAQGILTARGGRTSHAAVIARQLGRPCIVGCAALTVDLASRSCVIGGVRLGEGETICVDASSGRVLLGAPAVARARPDDLLARLESWWPEAATA